MKIDNKMNVSEEMYKSLIGRYENEIQECRTTLLIYFESSVGIGDHANHIDEMDGLVSKMAEAYDKLKMLKKIFKKNFSGGSGSKGDIISFNPSKDESNIEDTLYYSKL